MLKGKWKKINMSKEGGLVSAFVGPCNGQASISSIIMDTNYWIMQASY